jgi:2-keto-4-pentenoate hydratase/2-oxohepta-3-ene-1,7-dioic acid hydratase in catechol pathway
MRGDRMFIARTRRIERERLKLPGEAQMTSWVRFESAEGAGFGVLDGASIRVHEGDLFDRPTATGSQRRSASRPLTMPVRPGKVLAVWNNFRALIEKMSLRVPAEPLYFIKSPNAYLDPGATIRKPACDSRIIFEASSRS